MARSDAAPPPPEPPTAGETPTGLDGVDPAMLARAEAALSALSGEFAGWMAEELARLEAARERLRAGDATEAAWTGLHLCAHDLKGLGATYGHPLATRLCASLCRLLDDPARRAATPLALVDAHVDAVRATVDAGAEATPQALAVCAALEARVAEAVALRTG